MRTDKIADTVSMHEKERIFFPMHSVEALPQAIAEYMKAKTRPYGRILTDTAFD